MKPQSALLAMLLFCALAQPVSKAWAQQAPASPAAEADAHYKRAVGLFNEGDYSVALIEFKRAYEIAPAFQALYNIGETYYQLQDYAGALRTLEKYLADGGDKVPADRKDTVTKEIEKLRLRVAKIEIAVAEPGVEISVDDVSVGMTPLKEPILVSAGRRKITATQPGHPAVVKTIDLAGGDNQKVAFDLAAPVTTATVPTGQKPPEQRDVPVWPWVGTAVFAVGFGVVGGLALAASGDQKKLIETADVKAEDIKKGHDKVVTLAGVADGLFAATVVMGGISIVLSVTAGPKKVAPAPKGTGFHPVLTRVSAGPSGLGVSGTF